MLRNYKHIIWDWNGTLLNDVDLCLEVMNGMLAKRHLPQMTKAYYREIFTFPVRHYYEQLFDLADGLFEQLSIEFISTYEARLPEAPLHSGARAALEQINASGRSQSILTAAKQDSVIEAAQRLEIAQYFLGIVGLNNIYAHSKVENGKQWLAELNHDPNEVLLIGDTAHDFEVAQVLGVDCALIANGHQSKAKLDKCNVQIFASLRELF